MRIGMALLTTGALLALALWALPWVRDESGSLLADFTVLFVWTLLAFAAAWFQVVLVLPDRKEPRAADDVVAGSAAFRAHTVWRSLILVVAVVANFVWSDLVAGDFWFSHYSRLGVYATALRSPDPTTRRWAIARIAETADPALEDLVARLEPLLRDGDTEVRADAIAVHGHLAWRMRMALRVLEREGTDRARFEFRILKRVERALGDPGTFIGTTSGVERLASIVAAGALGNESHIAVLEGVCESGNPEEVVAAVDALADIGSPRALPVLGRVFTAPSGQAAVHAAWAMGLIMASVVGRDPTEARNMWEYQSARDTVRAHLPRSEPEVACAFLKWFPEIADASLTGALIELTRTQTVLLRCRRVERQRWFGAPEMIVPEVPVADLLLRALASVALGNDELKRFLEDETEASRLPKEIRDRFQELRDAVHRAR